MQPRALLLLLLAMAAMAAADSEHQCVWYGKCGRDPKYGDDRHILNCLYRGPAKRAAKSDVELMREIADMAENFNLPEAVLARCPTCLANFRKNFCDLTCRPDQSRFVNASKIIKANDFDGKLVDMVEEVTYYVHEDFAERTFRSCKDVLNPATSGSVMNLLCGPWGLHLCTARRWFDYMGSTSNGYAPFMVVYNYSSEDVIEPGGFEPHNPHVTPCNEQVGDEPSCSCTDCDSACVPPDFGVNDGAGFVIFGNFSGAVFFSLVAFIVGSLVFLATVFVSNVFMSGAGAGDPPSPTGSPSRELVEEIYPLDPSASPTHSAGGGVGGSGASGKVAGLFNRASQLFDRMGIWIEETMTASFTSLGTACARYPVPVIVLSIAFAAGLCTGIQWLEVETDPVELWAAPGSRSRIEKDFFDREFRPFYRTEQVIIHAKDLDPIYHLDVYEEMREFGPVFNASHFLLPVLDLQKRIESVVAEDGTTFQEVCNAPLSPQSTICNVQSLWAYWQDDAANLNLTGLNEATGHVDTYLDHFLMCSRNPANPSDGLVPPQSCMSRGGIPVQPYFVLGGFVDENATHFPKDPQYSKASAVVITLLVDNYDIHSNDPEVQMKLRKAMAWEKAFVEFMLNFTSDPNNTEHLDIAFNSQRSVEDELEKETSGDVLTIAVSYLIMFFYITFSLGQVTRVSTFMLESKVTLGLGGVLIVLLSVGASIGIFAFIGVKATLIIFEIIPFLVLAVGVDNIFIMVQTYQRDPRRASETHAEHVGRIIGEVAPSMLLSSLSESTCFFLGALSDMPAVKAFALYAGMALLIDFVMQITCFVSLISLDMARQEADRYDILCCVKASAKKKLLRNEQSSGHGEGFLYRVFKHLYVPFLMKKWVRPLVVVVFFGWFCSSCAVMPNVEVGLDQEITMPDESFVLKYFEYLKTYLSVGPPFYVVLNSTNLKFDYTDVRLQNRICGTSGCDADSLQAQIKLWSLQSNVTYVASPAQSWIDDYFAWMTSSQCCKYDENSLQVCQSNDPSAKKKKKKKQQSAPAEKRNDAADDFFGGGEDNFFGGAFDDFEDEQSTSEAPAPADTLDGDHLPDHMFSNYDEFYYYEDDDAAGKTRQKRSALARHLPAKCVACETRHRKERPTPEQFRKHLRWFMEDNPGETCPVAGQAAYRDCLRLTQLKDTSDGFPQYAVNASSFMAFHSILKTSQDYTAALEWSRRLTDALSETINRDLPEDQRVHVFTYSIFYVFYEQYLTIWRDTLQSLGVSLVAIFLVTFVLMGMDLGSSLIILLVIVMILVNMFGLMYWWSIQLNAVSLVNLVMAVGISVEFCSHMTRAFAVTVAEDKVARAKAVTVGMGSSVLSGITLTKFGGIVVLAFAKSQIFKIFYFRMYLGIVLIGAAQGLVFLPVLLSYVGPRINPAKLPKSSVPTVSAAVDECDGGKKASVWSAADLEDDEEARGLRVRS